MALTPTAGGPPPSPAWRMTRRQFLAAGAMGSAALIAGAAPKAPRSLAPSSDPRPNILFIITDQQGLDTIAAAGCPYTNTPNMDRLVQTGVRFLESHTTNPLCSPARSSMFTGRMPSETHVTQNNKSIRSDIPNLGQLLAPAGYETVYIGKWHVPASYATAIAGFDVIPVGISSQGHMGDAAVSRACEGYLANRSGTAPFFLVASLLQPHDICAYVSMHRTSPDVLPYPEVAGALPPMPPNFGYDPNEPAKVANINRPSWSEQQWRYYLWSYYHHIEMVDREMGRILQALDDFGYAANTLIIHTSDHGEGRGRHHMVLKNYLYEEAVKVPLTVCWPGHVLEGAQIPGRLVSGLDITPTICDYAGVAAPVKVKGLSLRPLLEGLNPTWRDFVVAEVQQTGRMIRSQNFKYIAYTGDPVEQLFDMQNDPGETVNLAGQSAYDSALQDHRQILLEWEASLEIDPPTAVDDWRRY